MAATGLARTAMRVAMVAPPRARVQVGAADLRRDPDETAELVDQAHLMEALSVLGTRDDWRFVQGEDHYFGWIRAEQIREWPYQETRVAVLLADVREQPSGSSIVVERLPAGTALPGTYRLPESPLFSADPDWIEVPFGVGLPSGIETRPSAPRVGYLAAADVARDHEVSRRYPTADDPVRSAEAFLGVPYLWGGTTALGIDCSGLVQQVYRLNGVALPRDADQQAMLGRLVDQARAGDLLFFGDESVTHVGLATGAASFIHAPRAGGLVERGQLGGGRKLRAVRRYLPEVAEVGGT